MNVFKKYSILALFIYGSISIDAMDRPNEFIQPLISRDDVSSPSCIMPIMAEAVNTAVQEAQPDSRVAYIDLFGCYSCESHGPCDCRAKCSDCGVIGCILIAYSCLAIGSQLV